MPDQPDPADDTVLVAWSVSTAPARWLPRLDEFALECLDQDAGPPAAGFDRRRVISADWGVDFDLSPPAVSSHCALWSECGSDLRLEKLASQGRFC